VLAFQKTWLSSLEDVPANDSESEETDKKKSKNKENGKKRSRDDEKESKKHKVRKPKRCGLNSKG